MPFSCTNLYKAKRPEIKAKQKVVQIFFKHNWNFDRFSRVFSTKFDKKLEVFLFPKEAMYFLSFILFITSNPELWIYKVFYWDQNTEITVELTIQSQFATFKKNHEKNCEKNGKFTKYRIQDWLLTCDEQDIYGNTISHKILMKHSHESRYEKALKEYVSCENEVCT